MGTHPDCQGCKAVAAVSKAMGTHPDRSFIWWPGLDKAIKEVAAKCEPCKVTVAMPKAVSRHPWQLPNGPWEIVHVDYGEWNNHYFFVLVDAFSKWPEVKAVSSTTSKATINIL